jgi:hypothetical protein
MARLLTGLALLLAFSGVASAQSAELAPTVAQRRADRAAYLTALAPDGNKLSFRTMSNWQQEMFDCRHADHDNESNYYIVAMDVAAFDQGAR